MKGFYLTYSGSISANMLRKSDNKNKTIGIVICKDKSETLVEYTLPETNDQTFASRYQTILPDKQTIIQLLNDSTI